MRKLASSQWLRFCRCAESHKSNWTSATVEDGNPTDIWEVTRCLRRMEFFCRIQPGSPQRCSGYVNLPCPRCKSPLQSVTLTNNSVLPPRWHEFDGLSSGWKGTQMVTGQSVASLLWRFGPPTPKFRIKPPWTWESATSNWVTDVELVGHWRNEALRLRSWQGSARTNHLCWMVGWVSDRSKSGTFFLFCFLQNVARTKQLFCRE